MTTATLFLPDETTHPFRAGLSALLRHMVLTIRRAIEVRRGLAQVRALDDHLLRDIGLTREVAEQAVRLGRI